MDHKSRINSVFSYLIKHDMEVKSDKNEKPEIKKPETEFDGL